MTTSPLTEQLLFDSLITCSDLYDTEMTGFYPRQGLINESNLVNFYVNAVKQESSKRGTTAYGWTEYLNGHGQRLDAVMKVGEDAVLIEAKRIKQGKSKSGKSNTTQAMESIHRDATRLYDPAFTDRLLSDLDCKGTVYRVLIAQLWRYRNRDASQEKARGAWLDKSAFPIYWAHALVDVKSGISAGTCSDLELLIAVSR